jgi:hypothetical protein
MMANRPLDVLLALVDAPTGLPFTGRGIVDCYQAGVITAIEAKELEQHSRRAWRVQKRMLAESRPAGEDEVEKMRAKLDAASAILARSTTPESR